MLLYTLQLISKGTFAVQSVSEIFCQNFFSAIIMFLFYLPMNVHLLICVTFLAVLLPGFSLKFCTLG